MFTNIGEKSFFLGWDNAFSWNSQGIFIWKIYHSKLFSTSCQLHKQIKYIKILLGFKVFKVTLERSDIFNALWESQELTIFLCIWKRNLNNNPIVGLSEHGAHTILGTKFS